MVWRILRYFTKALTELIATEKEFIAYLLTFVKIAAFYFSRYL